MVWTSDPAAYSKIILHSIRYPSQSVSGFLIGESVKKDGESVLHISDVLPLCHTNVQLLPNAEVGFSVAKAVAKEKKMRVVCFFFILHLTSIVRTKKRMLGSTRKLPVALSV